MNTSIKEPCCKNCRWAKEAKLPTKYNGERGGTTFGIAVWQGLWQGFRLSSDGDKHDALGAFYCEHHDRPRGLVLTNYVCRDHDLALEYDQKIDLKQVGRIKVIDAKPTKHSE